MKINIFIKNTVILVATSLILRTAGIFFKIYLAGSIGQEGIGLYQLIVSIYVLASTFTSSGISTAVTRLVADNLEKGRLAIKEIMKKALMITIAISLVTQVIIFFGADFIASSIIKDKRAALSLKILSCSLLPMGISSCVKGYFIACRKTVPPSISQIIEQAVRIFTVVIVITFNKTMPIEKSAAAVLFGDTLAETVSFFTHWVMYKKDIKGLQKGVKIKGAGKELIRISVPMLSTGYLSSLLHTAENILVPIKLAEYYGIKERGLALFGAIRGMAIPVLFFPASFLTSVSTLLIPEISYESSSGNKIGVKSKVEKSVGITLSLSICAGVLFFFHADEIGNILYNSRDVGAIIKILAPIVPFMYLESVASGMLKGLDGQLNMFQYNLMDSILRIIAVITVVSNNGIKGYLGIMLFSNCFTCTLCCYYLFKRSKACFKFKEWLLNPFSASILSSVIGYITTYKIGIEIIRFTLAISIEILTISYVYIRHISEERERFKKSSNYIALARKRKKV